MATLPNIEDYKELIEYVKNNFFLTSEDRLSIVDKKKRQLEAFSIAIKFLTHHPQDPSISVLARKSHTNVSFKNLGIYEFIEATRNKLDKCNTSAIGIHFIDTQVGRFSRIWTTNNHPTAREDQLNKTPIYQWIYSHTWMKLYWHLFGSTTSLINALHENVIKWNGNPFHINWNDKATYSSQVTLGDFQETKEIITLAKELSSVINNTLDNYSDKILHLSSKAESKGIELFDNELYRNTIEEIAESAHRELDNSFISKRLDEIFTILRRNITTDEEYTKHFKSSINKITSSPHKDDELFTKRDISIRTDKFYWNKLLPIIEALYSAIMNHGSFCSDTGFWINRAKPKSDLTAIIVIAFDKNNDNDDEFLSHLKTFINDLFLEFHENFIEPIYDEYIDPEAYPLSLPANIESSEYTQLAKKLKTILGIKKDYIRDHGIEIWARNVIALSKKSIHEGEETKFILGYGPAYLGQVRCNIFEKSPNSLDSINSCNTQRIDKTTHYLRSYYSIFGAENRICWFDPLGHLKGVYERKVVDEDGEWLWGWDAKKPSYVIAKILGLDKVDIYNSQGNIVLQYRDGDIREGIGQNNIRENIAPLIKTIFDLYKSSNLNEDNTTLIEGITNIVCELVGRYQELAIGTSLVVLRADKDKKNWPRYIANENGTLVNNRQPFANQKKKLTEELDRFKHRIASQQDICDISNIENAVSKSKLDTILNNVSILSKLDGATVLEFDELGLKCHPAIQIVPIINWDQNNSDETPKYKPLDILERTNPEPLDESTITSGCSIKNSKKHQLSIHNLRRLSKLLNGTVQPSTDDGSDENNWVSNLMFLNSAGTRHHSLWGITVTAEEPLFTITLSEDGDLRFFIDGECLKVENKKK
ncbi:MAG: hypothetical protein OQL19_18540 [Gammaproteobacteria bacterium]|nr:hypothetical protein [Gammaproteobacteria bacterium]